MDYTSFDYLFLSRTLHMNNYTIIPTLIAVKLGLDLIKMTITMNNLDFRCGSHLWIHCMNLGELVHGIRTPNRKNQKVNQMEPTSSNSQMRIKIIKLWTQCQLIKLKPCDYVWNWAKNEFLYESKFTFHKQALNLHSMIVNPSNYLGFRTDIILESCILSPNQDTMQPARK